MRRLVALLLVLSAALHAVDDEAQVLAAARAVSLEYQTRFRLLAETLNDPSEAVRLDGMRNLGALRDPQSVPLLMPFVQIGKHSVDEITVAATVLGRLGYQTPVPALRALTSNQDAGVRQAAILALDQIGVIAAGDWMQRSQETNDALRLSAIVSLGQLKHAEATDALIKGLNHPKSLIRQAACIGIGQLGERALGENLKVPLTDADPNVRRYAAEAIAKLGYTPAIPDLLLALEGESAMPFIVRALRVLAGQDFGFDPGAPLLMRQQAIERAFEWFASKPELKQ